MDARSTANRAAGAVEPSRRAPGASGMCGIVARCALGFALCSAAPALASGMGWDDARHLLGRTGFGPSVAEIRDFAVLTREQGVERLLSGARTEAAAAPPACALQAGTSPRALRAASVEARNALLAAEVRCGLALRAWWTREMLETLSPLTERMTLFWHGHFATSQRKVRFTAMLYRQNLLLRRHALGRFDELLHAVSRDPAMLLYLDTATSRAGRPNENFARELMELFTLGEGRYGEQDVREAARAFTGWSIDPESGAFLQRPFAHDGGTKTVLGRTGRFEGAEVLDILLAEPATALHVAGKLWREFVAPQAHAAELERVAARFRASGYRIDEALRALLSSAAFWAPQNRGTLVKSPAEFVVGTLRALEARIGDPLPYAFVMAGLGQNLFAPPNVKGWPGGEAWIDSATLLARKQFVERLLRGEATGATPAMTAAALPAAGRAQTPQQVIREARRGALRELASSRVDAEGWFARVCAAQASPQRTLLAFEAVTPASAAAAPREALRALALDPAYQLK
ncbi:MAG: DUF1800 domain-containing protein [Burkholderiales bacterium]|nr:DUF1800 domain-containing protein [Burkholderiales bacterium]